MDKEILDSIYNDLAARRVWAERQAVWYNLRRDGLRRKSKPFPGAADTHFPLVDTVIEKFKPFYINQLFASERLADFISRDPQMGEKMTEVAWWFDYKLKHGSNLESEMPFVFDSLLQNGRGTAKITWDSESNQVKFESVDPIYLIVPPDTESLQSADRIVHVQHMSPWKYANGAGHENRNQSEDFIKKITGAGNSSDSESNNLEITRAVKEGITYSDDKDLIIIWEIYSRTKDGWDVFTISPSCPDEEVRKEFKLPYKHGMAPFVEFTFEETEKGFYSPRGVAEILAPFESSLCKMWNEKHDAMSFYNRPLFYASRDIPNAGNIRMKPGDILPFEIRSVDRGAPPMSWDQEMMNTRMVAEQRISTPDFGIGGMDATRDNKTAREVDEISAQRNQIVDMRSRLVRRQLGDLYKQSWELLLQYDSDLEFFYDGNLKSLEKDAREAVVSIRPNGSSDSWNQHARLKKAIARKQLLGNSPFIDQGELDKSILELDEPGLVSKIFRDPATKQQDQVERIMLAIPSLEEGMAVQPRPDDDDALQASFLMEYLARKQQQGRELSPEGVQAMQGRLAAHMNRLKESNPKAARELEQKGRQIMMELAPEIERQQQAAMQGGRL